MPSQQDKGQFFTYGPSEVIKFDPTKPQSYNSPVKRNSNMQLRSKTHNKQQFETPKVNSNKAQTFVQITLPLH